MSTNTTANHGNTTPKIDITTTPQYHALTCAEQAQLELDDVLDVMSILYHASCDTDCKFERRAISTMINMIWVKMEQAQAENKKAVEILEKMVFGDKIESLGGNNV